jgi:uncharacterized Zn-binding protein involved in type VI secretion
MILPPVASVGDFTSHGTPLFPGIGSPNVLVGGRPTWRTLIDFHACPFFNGPIAHVGGVVLPIGKRALINGFPVAQQGDIIVEAGGPNTILVI